MTSAILYLDPGTGQPMPLTPPQAVLASSAALGWSRAAIVEHQLLPAQARPEHGILNHRAFVNLGPPVDFAWGPPRQRQRAVLPRGGMHAQPHGMLNAPAWGSPLQSLSLAFDREWLEAQAAPRRAAPVLDERRNIADPVMHALAVALHVELSMRWPDPLRGSGLLLMAALRLLEAHGAGLTPCEALTPVRARVALEAVEAGLDGPLTVVTLAAIAGLSEARFARGFAKRFGVPPHRYVLSRRLALARDLLARGEAAATVALHCGFYDQAHLTRAFRAAFGVPPAAWARDLRRAHGHGGRGPAARVRARAGT